MSTNNQADAATLIYDALAAQLVYGVSFNQALMRVCDGDWRLFVFALRHWPGGASQ